MKEIFVRGRSLPDAYHQAIAALHREGEVLTTRDWGQMQKEVSMTFVAEEPLAEPMVSKLYIGGFRELQQYAMEILDGILDFRIGDGWDYTYHDRMVNFPLMRRGLTAASAQGPADAPVSSPIEVSGADSDGATPAFDQVAFVIGELRRQTDSRRAVIAVRDNGVDPFSDDPACLQHIQYLIRDGALHCKVLMRSNDAPKASFMNAFAFVLLQRSIADDLGIGVGSYTHRANSYHAYERDFKLLEQYATAITEKPMEEITYPYESFFKELMEESIPAIRSMADGLRDKKGAGRE